MVSDPAMLVKFLKQAFGATGDLQKERPSVITIGDSL
ncbi:MAG: bleomycin resistance protein, partial [Acidobacteria bacterium]